MRLEQKTCLQIISLTLLALVCFAPQPLAAQKEGESRTIGTRSFVFHGVKGVWVEKSLPGQFSLERAHTCLHDDDEWFSWYYGSDGIGKKILELKPGVIFWHREKDKAYPRGCFQNEAVRERATSIPATPPQSQPAQEGDRKTVGGRPFVFTGDTWIDESLKDGYKLLKDYTSVYKSEKWHQWFDQGDSSLREVLGLGPNVFFLHRHAAGDMHPHGVFKNKNLQLAAHEISLQNKGGRLTVAAIISQMAPSAAVAAMGEAAGTAAAGGGAAAAGGAAATSTTTILGMSVTTASVIGAGVVAGAVAVQSSSSGSKTKR